VGLGEERLEVLEDLESDENFLLCLRRTEPSDVTVREGALLDRECFRLLVEDDFVAFRLWPERLSGILFAGIRAKDERDNLCDSWSKVLMASSRDELDRLMRAV